jgi:hypothetical protein
MYKGTTPDINIIIPDDIPASEIQQLWLTFSQNGGEKLNKTKSDFTQNGQIFSVRLTQAETLELDADEDLEMQIRLLLSGEKALASKIKKFKVDDVLKGGEITNG